MKNNNNNPNITAISQSTMINQQAIA